MKEVENERLTQKELSLEERTDIEELRRDIFKCESISEIFLEAMYSKTKTGAIFSNEDLLHFANILIDYTYGAKLKIEKIYSRYI